MGKVIDQERFTRELFDILEETFETHHGIFLDRNTSLLETLETINAAEASRPVGGKCASLAAQVAHVTFYLEVLERYLLTQDSGDVDWGEIWRTIREVTPAEWVALKQQLKETYQRVFAMMRGFQSWDDETLVGGALAIVVHTAYHLGEIRQALCTVK
ncbi:MAG: DinB family protein [Chloroflexota bacterium]